MRTEVTDIQYGNQVVTTVKIGGVDYSNKVVKIGKIGAQVKDTLMSSYTSVQVEMHDIGNTVGSLLEIIANVNGTSVSMFKGMVVTSDTNPDTKTINLTADSNVVYDKTIRASVSMADYPELAQDGPGLPIVFGSGIKYPIQEAWPRTKLTLQSVLTKTTDTAVIDGGEELVQGVTTQIVLGGLVCEGTFEGNEFTMSDFNLPFYDDLTITPTSTTDHATVTSASGGVVALTDMYVKYNGMVNFCYMQKGNVCYFLLKWPANSQAQTNCEASFCQRTDWNAVLDTAEAAREGHWTWNTIYVYEEWVSLKPGTSGFLLAGNAHKGKHVVNVLGGTTVLALYAYRTINGLKQLTMVPTSLYSTSEQAIDGVGTCTVVTIWPPLSMRANSTWSDELFVTARSPVGPTVSSVLSYLAGLCNASVSSVQDVSTWRLHTVFYGDQKVSSLIDALAAEICTPVRLNYSNVVVGGTNATIADDQIYDRSTNTQSDLSLANQIRATWRKSWSLPEATYVKKTNATLNNIVNKSYRFLTNATLVETSANWWLSKLSTLDSGITRNVDHTFYKLEVGDYLDGKMVEAISYDLIEPKVSVSTVYLPSHPTPPTITDPAANIKTTNVLIGDSGSGGGQEEVSSSVTTGVIWDGNTLTTTGPVYGCKTYLGTDIANETPACLPGSAVVGEYTSGVPGICRVKVGNKFVLAYSTLSSWLRSDLIVQLGDPVNVHQSCSITPPDGYTNTNGKVYPIIAPEA